MHYLGHIISKEGISVDLENIKAIRDWQTPMSVDEIRSLMGLVGYYMIYIYI